MTRLTRLTWARRLIAFALLVAGFVVLASGHPVVCDQQQSDFGSVSTVCRGPQAHDPFVLAGVLIFLMLLAPDLAEFGVPGLLSLKLRVREQEQRAELTATAVEGIRVQLGEITSSSTAAATQSTVVNLSLAQAGGLQTARLASAADREGGARSDRVAEDRFITGERALEAMLADAAAELDGAQIHLYMPNSDGVLVPVDEPERSADEAGWPAGSGVVGRVWATGDRRTVRGAELARDFGQLAASRAERYRSLQAVTAVPVVNEAARVIAVLSAAWQREPTELLQGQALDVLRLNAVMCARIIVDLLGWDDDWPSTHGHDL